MSDPSRSTARRRAARPLRDTDPMPPPESDETPAEETLRQVLADVTLPMAARVAADSLIDEIVEVRRAQDQRLGAIESAQSRWNRVKAIVGTVSAAGVASALAYVAATLIQHGDARAAARQQIDRLDAVVEAVRKHSDEFTTLRLQVAADHSLLSLCAARLGAAPQGSP